MDFVFVFVFCYLIQNNEYALNLKESRGRELYALKMHGNYYKAVYSS